MLAVMVTALLAGCTIGPDDLQTYLEKNNLTSSITYYGNGGIFRENTNMTSIQLYYHDQDPAINITDQTDSRITFARIDYVLIQWEYAQTDENGEVVYSDENKTQVETTGEVVNLDNLVMQSGQHLKIVAVWKVDVLLDYVLVSDTPITVTENVEDEEGNVEQVTKVYNSGDIIYSASYGAVGVRMISDVAPAITVTDATYLEYFVDEECTQSAISMEYTRPENGVNNKIYVKYMSGLWTVVKTPTQFSNMYYSGLSISRQYYIYNDINCAALSPFSMRSGTVRTNCIIEGNGKTISNLQFAQNNISGGLTYSMFGVLGANSKISNLTFKDVTMTTSIRNGFVSLYMFNSGAMSGYELDNFHIDGISMSITVPDSASIQNIPKPTTGYDTSNWKFGGSETDAEFDMKGLVISGASLTINDELLVDGANYGTLPQTLSNITAYTPYYKLRKENT